MTEQEIFIEAMDRTDPVERQRFLSDACAGDSALLERVEKLIRQSEQLGSFLEHPAAEARGADSNWSSESSGISNVTLLCHGSSDDGSERRLREETTRMNSDVDDEIPLGYLQPSSKPNSMGRLGHYEVLEVVGRGAFGTVLRAFDEKLQRVVAIKVLVPEMAATSPARKRFLREARTSAAIRHENVVAIYAVEDEPIPYLVMEYVPGQTLQQRLDKSGPLPVMDVLKLGKQIADGLAAAHAQDLIHRDIKPGNILLEGGMSERVKITDFGLARTADDASMTQSGLIAGTPMYMAPEQAMGQKLDQRADLFSLGSVLYQMLSGRPPFRASNTVAVLKRVVDDTPRPIQEIIPEVPTWMCDLVSYLHVKNPDERIQSAKEVSDLLGHCIDDLKAGRVPKDLNQSRSETTKEFRKTTIPDPRETSRALQKPLVRVAAALMVLLVLVAMITGFGRGLILRSPGTVTLECSDPELVISVDNVVVSLNPFRNPGGVAEKHSRSTTIGLAPGEHRVQLMKGGRLVHEQILTVQSGTSVVVELAVPNDQSNVAGTLPPQPLAKSGWHNWPVDAPPPAIAPFDAAQAKAHQEAWAKYLDLPVEYTNSIGMKFRLIPPGEFLMGSTPEEIEAALKMIPQETSWWQEAIKSEAPQHKVILTQPIYVGETEVTQAQYEQVMGNNPSQFVSTGQKKDVINNLRTGTHPVETVSWNEAAEFCMKLSQQAQLKPSYARVGETITLLKGTGYRLPSEAEWEFACRAGTTTRFWSGNDDAGRVTAGWCLDNSDGRTHAAGEWNANPFGLSDVHGNVWEWVQDYWDAAFYGQFTKNPAVDPFSSSHLSARRVLRGGALADKPFLCGSSGRNAHDASIRDCNIGFRVVLPADAVMQAIQKQPEPLAKTGWHNWSVDAPPPAIAPFNAAQAKAHQEAWAKHLGVPVEYTNSIGMKFRLIPPGEFLMGSTPEEIEAALKETGDEKYWQECVRSEAPQHTVILTQPIYMGVHEVTQAEYEKVMGVNPSYFGPMGMGKEAVAGLETAEHPVEMVSWNDAAEFCAKLSRQEKHKPFDIREGEKFTPLDGTGYRLPTEAEWEFACRAGTATKYWIGDKDENLINAGWFSVNSEGRTHAAGELRANPFGLFDIHGNVWERVQDGWIATWYGQFSQKSAVNPLSPIPADSLRMFRGGSFQDLASNCRSSNRQPNRPTDRYPNIGFRVSLSVDAVKEVLAARTPAVTNTKPDAPSPAIAPFDAAQAKAHQEAWAKHLGVPVEYTNALGMKFVLIPPGEFTMGSTPEEIAAALRDVPPDNKHFQECIKSEAPQHKVILTQPIYLGVNEVTQAEYEKVMGSNPSDFAPMGMGKEAVAGLETAEHPVETVSWNDAAEFCAKLSKQEKLKPFYFRAGETITPLDGTGYRLPSEAEWEFACRAGTVTSYWIGDKDEDLVRAGCFGGNSGGRTHAAGELKANPFGLYDIHGNVWEWVQDGWDATYYGQFSPKPTINPISPFSAGSQRVIRGGGWNTPASFCRSSGRYAVAPLHGDHSIGFRVSLSVDAVKAALAARTPAVTNTKRDAPSPAIAPFNAAQAKAHQAAWAKHLGVPVEYTNSIGMKFRLIPPGEFMMGSTPEEIAAAVTVADEDVTWCEQIQSEAPRHKVILTRPIYVGVTEVTQTQYQQVMGANPSHFSTTGEGAKEVANLKTGNLPVEMVSWNDAAEFCAKLSQQENLKPFYLRSGETVTPLKGTGYRLPTEAEWESACRAGTTTQYWSGDEDQDLSRVSWCANNSEGRTHAVGELSANPFGLSDMHGNVWEWGQDSWDHTFYRKFQDVAAINPSIPFSADSQRVIRGGFWGGNTHCRSSSRFGIFPTLHNSHLGFRVVLGTDAVKQ